MYNQVSNFFVPRQLQQRFLERANHADLLKKAGAAINKLRKQKLSDELHLLNVPSKSSDLDEINNIADYIRNNFKKLTVLGTGGSTLSGQTWVNFSHKLQLPIDFIDNIDPITVTKFLDDIKLEETCFLVISKSGKTVETLSQVLTILGQFKIKNCKVKDNFIFITQKNNNPLQQLAASFDCRVIEHDNVGGRFSILSNVGFIPAALAGLDLSAIRSGAENALNSFLKNDTDSVSSDIVTAIKLQEAGLNLAVFMPYIDRLSSFANWYRQIIAESLGKNGYGPTPLKAMGTLDQHSQLQLYLDGPRDKYFTFINLRSVAEGPIVRNTYGIEELQYLQDKSLGEIINAEQQATISTLKKNDFPLRTITFDQLDEYSLGALTMTFILETITQAYILNINPFDQPAVEANKVLTRDYLKKKISVIN